MFQYPEGAYPLVNPGASATSRQLALDQEVPTTRATLIATLHWKPWGRIDEDIANPFMGLFRPAPGPIVAPYFQPRGGWIQDNQTTPQASRLLGRWVRQLERIQQLLPGAP